MAGGAIEDAERGGTPRSELARIRARRAEREEGVREAIMEATLEACGEHGFRAATVQDAIDRWGGSRTGFYRQFKNKSEAYAAAHEVALEALRERLLGAAREAAGWRPGVRAALEELASYLAERPLLAKGVLVEVHVAGDPALARRAEVQARLVEALDRAREELPEGDGPPPLTARFMLGAVDAAAAGALATGEPAAFADAVPELTRMIVAAYFG
jgi:AcrR family transcriptional regulator